MYVYGQLSAIKDLVLLYIYVIVYCFGDEAIFITNLGPKHYTHTKYTIYI